MRKLWSLLLLLFLLVINCSCEYNPPYVFEEPLTKWEAQNFELYISKYYDSDIQTIGVLVYTKEDSSVVFNVENKPYSPGLLVYSRANSDNNDITLVATYYNTISLSNTYCTYGLYETYNSDYADILPQNLHFKRIDDSLSDEEIIYEWQPWISEQAEALYKNR